MSKTEISLPDDLFTLANTFAHDRGISLSELCTAALSAYLAKHTKAELTERINAAYKKIETDLPDDLAAAIRQKMLKNSW